LEWPDPGYWVSGALPESVIEWSGVERVIRVRTTRGQLRAWGIELESTTNVALTTLHDYGTVSKRELAELMDASL
jgi:hypothetical protein